MVNVSYLLVGSMGLNLSFPPVGAVKIRKNLKNKKFVSYVCPEENESVTNQLPYRQYKHPKSVRWRDHVEEKEKLNLQRRKARQGIEQL